MTVCWWNTSVQVLILIFLSKYIKISILRVKNRSKRHFLFWIRTEIKLTGWDLSTLWNEYKQRTRWAAPPPPVPAPEWVCDVRSFSNTCWPHHNYRALQLIPIVAATQTATTVIGPLGSKQTTQQVGKEETGNFWSLRPAAFIDAQTVSPTVTLQPPAPDNFTAKLSSPLAHWSDTVTRSHRIHRLSLSPSTTHSLRTDYSPNELRYFYMLFNIYLLQLRHDPIRCTCHCCCWSTGRNRMKLNTEA